MELEKPPHYGRAATNRLTRSIPEPDSRQVQPYIVLNTLRLLHLLALPVLLVSTALRLAAATVSSPFGTSYQVNVNAAGQNIPGDAANEPSFCIDPTNPKRMAVGWRQFDSVTNNFRQAGWGYSTNGGLNWTVGGVLEPGIFRSDPVLAADAEGRFYYLSLLSDFHCDLWRSTNGGMTWERLSYAFGGDKPLMTIDTTTGIGRGNIYHACSPFYTYSGDQTNMFTRSTDAGLNWMPPMAVPQFPYWGTLDVGPAGELFVVGTDGFEFVVNRSSNAANPAAFPVFELTQQVSLGGSIIYGAPVNPAGLLGQAYIAVDRSTGPTRGNVYLLCSVVGGSNPSDVMFSRSTDSGSTWSAPLRINDDAPDQNADHWFGTMSVAPNGRIDVCWYDTRNSASNTLSELYYTWSEDGGLTFAANRPLSPAFDHSLGYPAQQKMGDYIGMVSLNEGACIVYTATHNGEEDLYFVRAELPIKATIHWVENAARILWNAVPGGNYCVQVKASLGVPWSAGTNVACIVSTNYQAEVDDPTAVSRPQSYYRILRQP